MTQELKRYIKEHRLCKENLFEDWESFVDFLYAQDGRVDSILWFEYIPISEKKGYLRPDKYPDPQDPGYLYQETPVFQDGFEEMKPDELKAHIRSVQGKSPDRKLVPCFYLFENDGLDLYQYDNKCVRITDRWEGNVFDGICMYNSRDYNKHEFGRYEEGLQLPGILFFQSDILTIESLEEHRGPYGRFSDPYGKLEEAAVEDGADIIEEILTCEEPEHVNRMFRCLDHYLDPACEKKLADRQKIIEMLRKFPGWTTDETLRKEAERLIRKGMKN